VELFRSKVVEAVIALERLNSRIIGLGGLSASYTDGGQYLIGKTRAAITTGHNYTVANMVNTLQEAVQARSMKMTDLVVAIVGAAGSVGSGVATICAAIGVKELILIDKREVQDLVHQLCAVSNTPVHKGSFRDDIPKAHAVLVATSSHENLFLPSDLREGAIIIDDSQPKNVGEHLTRDRPDVLILEGGSVALPPGTVSSIHKAFGPKLKNFDWRHINTPLAGDAEVPSCLAEVLLLTLLGEEGTRCSVGRSDPALAVWLNEQGAAAGFRPGRLQAFGKAHEDGRHWINEPWQATISAPGTAIGR
jgi:predicted amino acid dehydrogenase